MPSKWAFDLNRAKILKQVADERRRHNGVNDPSVQITNVRGCIVVFDTSVPAILQNGENWTPGVGEGIVWKRDAQSDETDAQDPDNAIVVVDLIPSRDSETNLCERVRVLNTTFREVPACVPVECYQDSYGDIYVYDNPDVAGVATHFDQTTTTTAVPCSGNCKWTWVAASEYWELTTDACAQTTTTSTSTTTVNPNTTTSTTTENCHCPALTNPASTTPDPNVSCECQYPDHCGTTDGECTFTQCASGNAGYHVDCTTTTTCDCNTTTTTTLPPSCGGCEYSWTAVGWVLTNDDCTSTYYDHLGRYCTCDCIPPASSGALLCEISNPACVVSCSGGIGSGCGGGCTWFYDIHTALWYVITSSCVVGSDCVCTPPSETPSECVITRTPCQDPTSSPSDTDPSNNPFNCGHCYTTTTSTTPAPECPGDCKWEWNGTTWLQLDNPCTSSCFCVEPFIDGVDETCEVRWSPCLPTVTTTSTTTTTTTLNCHVGYGCLYTMTSINVWTLDTTPPSDECEIGCDCPDPSEVAFPCYDEFTQPVGSQRVGNCEPTGNHPPCVSNPPAGLYCDPATECPEPTTTTTEAPTTTTTTTTTVCPGCESAADIEEACGPEFECEICWSCVDTGGGSFAWLPIHSDPLCNSNDPQPTDPCATQADRDAFCVATPFGVCLTCDDCATTTTTPP